MLFAAAIALSLAHPALVPDAGTIDCAGPPPILSYHIHVIYLLTDDAQMQRAAAFRDEARLAFAHLVGEDCYEQRRDLGRLCFMYDHPFNETFGAPFVGGEWSMFGKPRAAPPACHTH